MFFDPKKDRTTWPEECELKIKELDAFSLEVITSLLKVKRKLDEISDLIQSKIYSNSNKEGFIFSDIESYVSVFDIGDHIENLKLKFDSDIRQWKDSIHQNNLEIAMYQNQLKKIADSHEKHVVSNIGVEYEKFHKQILLTTRYLPLFGE